MGLLSNLKQIRSAMKSGVYAANPTAEQLAVMTPEQRDAVGQRQAMVQKATADAVERAKQQGADLFAAKPVHGPAGEYLYPEIARTAGVTAAYAAMSPKEMFGHSLQQMKQEFTGGGPALPEPPQLDPAQRAAGYTQEVAARISARRPYLPETAVVVQSHRIGSTAREAVETLAQHLGATGLAGRPDLVYGVYQVPGPHRRRLPAVGEEGVRRVGDRARTARRARADGPGRRGLLRGRAAVGRTSHRRAVGARRGPRPGLAGR